MTTCMLLFKSWWSPAHGGTHIKRVYRMPAHGHGESGGSSRNLGQSFWELANLAISSSNQNKIVDIAPVPDWEVREAKDQAQLDIAGFHHVADMYAIRHAINQHGNSQKEAARGQIAITTQDIIAIPDAVLRPDAVVYGFKNNRGQDMVASIKRQTDGTLLVVKEVRTGRKALAMASMRKLPAAKDFDSVVRTLLSNARSDGGSGLKIVEHAEFSNFLHKGTPMNPIALLFKSLVPSHTRRLKTGKVIRVRQYSNKVTKRPDDDGTLDMFSDDTITEPRKDLIDEHKRLVDVLTSPSHKDDKIEAKRQEKELEGYQKKEDKHPWSDVVYKLYSDGKGFARKEYRYSPIDMSTNELMARYFHSHNFGEIAESQEAAKLALDKLMDINRSKNFYPDGIQDSLKTLTFLNALPRVERDKRNQDVIDAIDKLERNPSVQDRLQDHLSGIKVKALARMSAEQYKDRLLASMYLGMTRFNKDMQRVIDDHIVDGHKQLQKFVAEIHKDDDDPESALRASWTEQGVPKARQDELIAQIAGKAKPGAKVGPWTIGGAKGEDENNHMIAHMAQSMAGGAGKLGDMIAQLGKTANKDWQYEKALDDPAFARAYQQHYLDAWAVSEGIKRLDEKYPKLKIMEKIAGPEAMRLISDYASHRYYEPDKQTLQNLIGDSKPHLKTLKTKTPKVTLIKEVDGRVSEPENAKPKSRKAAIKAAFKKFNTAFYKKQGVTVDLGSKHIAVVTGFAEFSDAQAAADQINKDTHIHVSVHHSPDDGGWEITLPYEVPDESGRGGRRLIY